MARVHSARLPPAGVLRRRKRVAVKVQRPGARYVMLRDLAMVKTFLCHPLVRKSFAWDPADDHEAGGGFGLRLGPGLGLGLRLGSRLG